MSIENDRRLPVRKDLSLDLVVSDADDHLPLGQLLNVSESGALLRTETRLNCFQTYDLEAMLLHNDGCMSKLQLAMRPIWGKHDKETNYYYYGIQFCHEDNEKLHASDLIMNELSFEGPSHYH